MTGERPAPSAVRRNGLVWAWSTLLSLVLLGPALGPGYVLSFDMVWVADLAVRADTLGLGSGLPRAVPSDAVVGVLDEAVPGMLLQKLVLVGSLAAAGAGAGALVGHLSTAARLVAASVYAWNPFVVERLVIGHWPVLVGYAVLPWLVVAFSRMQAQGRMPPLVLLLLPLGSLSAGAGLVTSVVTFTFGIRTGGRRTFRHHLGLIGLVVAANLPWIVAGALHSSTARTDLAGGPLFALRGEGLLPGPLTALGLGGIWNAEVVPATREGGLAVAALVVLGLFIALGVRGWWSRAGTAPFLVCWVLGFGIAVFTWAAPGVSGWLAATVPGGGLLRDGARWLALCAPLLAVLVAHGAERLRGLAVGDRFVAGAIGALAAVLPLALMPDAGWGASGRLDAVAYPAIYDHVREAVDDGGDGDVLVLPFSSYRAPGWNGGRKVLDPTSRVLAATTVTNDELVVSGRTIEGEDPRAAVVRSLLERDGDAASDLADLGFSHVVTDRSAPGPVIEVDGEVVLDQDGWSVVRLSGVSPQEPPGHWAWSMAIAWAGFVALPLAWFLLMLRPGSLRRTLRNVRPRRRHC